jgi:hypothetical protein
MEKVRTEQVTGYLNVLAETGNARRWKHWGQNTGTTWGEPGTIRAQREGSHSGKASQSARLRAEPFVTRWEALRYYSKFSAELVNPLENFPCGSRSNELEDKYFQ